MQLVTVSAVFFAVLANAAHHHAVHGQRFHHRRALNASDSGTDPVTTLTVNVTSIRTVFGCPITKTDCPVATHPVSIVTDIVAVYTTVCPLSAAQSISASILSSGATGGIMTSSTLPVSVVPLVTGAKVADSAMPSSQLSSMTDATLTYVLGTGTALTTVTTTIKQYKTATDYVTKYITKPSPSATVSGVEPLMGNEAVVSGSNTASGHAMPASGSSMEPTTTITSTSTLTKTITVKGATPGAYSSGKPMNNSPLSSNPPMKAATTVISNAAVAITASAATVMISNAAVGITPSLGGCPAPVTVTVAASTITVALSTLTVTYTEMGIPNTPIALIASADPLYTDAPKVTPAVASPTLKMGSNSPVSTSSLMSAYIAPYGNGTVATKIKPSCGSSGFLTKGRAGATGKAHGTGYYHSHGTGYIQSKGAMSPTGMAAPSMTAAPTEYY